MTPFPEDTAKNPSQAVNASGGWRLWGLLGLLLVLGLTAARVVYSITRADADSLKSQSESAYLNGDYLSAVDFAEKAIQLDPGNARAHFLLGKAQERLGKFELALAAHSEAAKSNNEVAREAMLRSGRILMHELGRPADAEPFFRDVLNIDPNNIAALNELIMLYGVSARQFEAVPLILKLFQQKHVTVELVTLLGNTGGRLNSPQLANRFREKSPADPNVQLAAAWKFWNSPESLDLNRAREMLETGLADHPDFRPLREALVEVLWSQGDAAGAASHLKFCFEGKPTSTKMWIIRGQLAERSEKFREAARCYWEAYRELPNREATFHLAETLSRLKKDELANALRERIKDLRKLKQASDILHNGTHDSTRPLRDVVKQSEKTCRLWEAWAWCQISETIAPKENWHRARAKAIRFKLNNCPDRIVCPSCDAIAIDLSDFPLPGWEKFEPVKSPTEKSPLPAISFRDDAPKAGVSFQYFNSPHTEGEGQKMYEFPGGGCAVLDFDGDGWPDLYLTQGCNWPVKPSQTEHIDRLFRNQGNGRFDDVTAQAGLVENHFSSGVASGDFDNDGFPDLYIANLGGNRLYHNNGDGTFADVTDESGVSDPAWSSSAVIADLNADGLPDIYSVNYVEGKDVFERICRHLDGHPRMCMPFHFDGAQDQLYLNLGDGRFENVTDAAGIVQSDGKGLGVVAADFTGDGQLDLFVANDTVMNFLFVNQTDSPGGMPEFSEEALLRGVAINGSGKAEGCMGIAVGDADADGRLDLFVTNFHLESNTLYLQTRPGLFQDRTQEAGLSAASLTQLGFGTQFIDADLDGQLDLIATNGHIDDLTSYGRPYRMPSQFFYNQGRGRFQEAAAEDLGEFFRQASLGRGMARCDWNRDGQEDVVISYLDRPAALLTNVTEKAGNHLALRFQGVESNRDAIGVRVKAKLGNRSFTRVLGADGGYQASNQKQLVLGLGTAERVDELEVIWPLGTSQTFSDVPANQDLLLIESNKSLLPIPRN